MHENELVMYIYIYIMESKGNNRLKRGRAKKVDDDQILMGKEIDDCSVFK